jgi:thiamine pyrophosphate-dependent acetolactate synthase large subunit-like protein
MEIVYFSLGIVTVLLVLGVVVIVRVGTLVKELKEKVREFEIHIDGVHRRIDDETREIRLHIKDTLNVVSDIKDVLHRTLDDTAKDIYQRVDEVENYLEKQLDSRLDKLENKIKSSKDL